MMKKNRVTEPENRLKGAIEILFGIVIVIEVFLLGDQIKALQEWSYVGVFVISLLSAATMFLPAPGWVIVLAMARILNPLYVGIAAGIGSGLGEINGYLIGQGAKDATDSEERFKKWSDWIRKNDFLVILVLAFIPNPLFDIAGLAAGALGVLLWRFLLACVLGRTLRYLLLAYLSAFSIQYL